MKRTISCILLLCLVSAISFAKGKADTEVPTEDVEYAFKGDEPSVNTEEEEKPLVPLYTLREPTGKPVELRESWGYVMQSRIGEYNNSMPLTDVCFFSAEVNCYGELVGIPNRSKINTGKARCHLVITCDSRSLTHFILAPGSKERSNLLKAIVKAGQPYDGVQIDFELVPARDRKHFITFLADLRYMLGKVKWFTVCVPARFRLLSEDIYPYAEIAQYSDRVFIMAYDEHWSTSRPGPVASVDWCRKVMEYAQKSIPPKKLIMGIPFYGRTWANETTAGGWYFSGANRIMTEHKVPEVVYESDIPTFKYTASVDVTGYFNDTYSVLQLCRLYEEAGIHKMGFWRVGQEDPTIWDWIKIVK
ncbi:MAG: glycoside hydrolase [Treponema sp.]|nr:glycoside hydrolase [Treponema sp.]